MVRVVPGIHHNSTDDSYSSKTYIEKTYFTLNLIYHILSFLADELHSKYKCGERV